MNKVYFPRISLPLVPTLTSLVDMLAAGILLVPLLYYYGMAPSWRVVFLPAIMVGMVVWVYGLSLLASAASSRYKDLRHLIPFLSQLLFFSSTVFISHAQVPGAARWMFLANPLTTYLDAFRWAVFPIAPAPEMTAIAITAATSVLLLVAGLVYFRRQEATLVDIL
jgi:lipopolysaccharide transport system permease protein